MGQDGGSEESGPSRHVNIPWSYWLSKYEIRNDQYLDFINSALVAGYVYREGVATVHAHGSSGGKTCFYVGIIGQSPFFLFQKLAMQMNK